jgi:hypothetical protein
MSDTCANCGKSKDEVGKKLPVCKGCDSRAYCSVSCQKAHWKAFHRSECKSLKEERERIYQETGVKPTRGAPAVMSRRNLETGRSSKHMTRPTTRDHQMANVRQSMAEILDTANKDSSSYVCMASHLSLAFGERRFSDLLMACRSFPSFETDPLAARMYLGYCISEFSILAAITKAFPPGPALRKDGVYWGVTIICDQPNVARPQGGMKPNQIVAESKKDPPLRKLVLPTHEEMNHQKDAFRRVIAGPSGPTLEHINLIGTAAVVNDKILELIAERCQNLEFFGFGQDNRYIPRDDITIVGLVKLASSCKKLRFLRIVHRCKGNLDSSDREGLICKALTREGFILRFIPDAEEAKRELALDLEGEFWRADIEDGLMSASWYERFESNQQKKQFFAKHFPHWV